MTPFNWLTFLEQAIEKEPSGPRYYAAIKLAEQWPTCACGELCGKLPRWDVSGEPTDRELGQLGSKFWRAVAGREWHEALSIFRQIEARTAQLLSEQTTTEK